MTRPRVFVTGRVSPGALERLAAAVEVEVREHPFAPPLEAVRERVRGCSGILSLLNEATAELALALLEGRRLPHLVNPEVL